MTSWQHKVCGTRTTQHSRRSELKLEEVLRNQAGRGQVLIMPEAEAKNRFQNLVVASLGAQKKEKPGGVISACVLFDGPNGNFVNTSTHLRDQEGEVTFGLTSKQHTGKCPSIGMTGTCWDVSSKKTREVFVNTVGTFGVSPASYYWSRVSAAAKRLTQYLISQYATTWIMLLADDYHVEFGGAPDPDCGERAWHSLSATSSALPGYLFLLSLFLLHSRWLVWYLRLLSLLGSRVEMFGSDCGSVGGRRTRAKSSTLSSHQILIREKFG